MRTLLVLVTAIIAVGSCGGGGKPGVGAVNWADRSYSTDCGRIHLRDGGWNHPPHVGDAIDSFAVHFADVTGGGQLEVVVDLGCAEGTNLVLPNIFVFTMAGGKPRQVGQTIHESLNRLSPFVTSVPVYENKDPRCCPSSEDRHTWTLKDGRWVVVGTERVGQPNPS